MGKPAFLQQALKGLTSGIQQVMFQNIGKEIQRNKVTPTTPTGVILTHLGEVARLLREGKEEDKRTEDLKRQKRDRDDSDMSREQDAVDVKGESQAKKGDSKGKSSHERGNPAYEFVGRDQREMGNKWQGGELNDEIVIDSWGCTTASMTNENRRAVDHWKQSCIREWGAICSTRTTVLEGFKRTTRGILRDSTEYYEVMDKVLQLSDPIAMTVMMEEGSDDEDDDNHIAYFAGQIFVHHKSEVGAMFFVDHMTKVESYKKTRVVCKLAKTNMNVTKYEGMMRVGKINQVIFLKGNSINQMRDMASARMLLANPGNWAPCGAPYGNPVMTRPLMISQDRRR
jgi:hypothetical protein